MLRSGSKSSSSDYDHVNDRPSVISLFCGAGGMDLGFNQAGFDTLLAIDNEKYAVNTYNQNLGCDLAICEDLSKIGTRRIVKEISQRSDRIPCGIIGGPPCQGFSRGNVTRNPRDPRNQLPYVYAALAKGLNRKYALDFFLFENVTGLLRKGMKNKFTRIKNAFEDAGFHILVAEIDAANFGVPQHRKRLFILGLNKKLFKKSDFTFPKGNKKLKTVRQAIQGLPPPAFLSRCSREVLSNHHDNHWTMSPVSWRFKGRFFNKYRSFRKLMWGKPSPTVAYGNREIHIHPNGKRRLSIFEAMLLQGFPTSYKLSGFFSQQVTQVCNAVPPPVAKSIAHALKKMLLNQK